MVQEGLWFPPKAHTIRAVIEFILTEFPGLEARIAWNVPTIRQGKDHVAGIDAASKHLTFSAWSPEIIAAFGERLDGYTVLKNCFHLPVDW